MNKWDKDSWRNHQAKHIPVYPDQGKLKEIENTLKDFPPLVFAGEVRSLKNSLSEVADGNAFLLQGGDCAESFSEFHADNIPCNSPNGCDTHFWNKITYNKSW